MGSITRSQVSVLAIAVVVSSCKVFCTSSLSNSTSSSDGDPKGAPDDVIISGLAFAVAAASLSVAAVIVFVISVICCIKCRMSQSSADEKAAYTGFVMESRPEPYAPPYTERNLAHSAQMYHFEHQKQQILEEERANKEAISRDSDSGSDIDGKEGDYTVFNCPGPAMEQETGEIEIGNPNFSEDTITPDQNSADDQLRETTESPETTRGSGHAVNYFSTS